MPTGPRGEPQPLGREVILCPSVREVILCRPGREANLSHWVAR
jgi:hypothetical protein